MKRWPRAPLIPVLLLALACAGEGTKPSEPEGELTGVWRTEGYGHLLAIDVELARFYEETAISCLPSWELEVGPASTDNAEAVLAMPAHGLLIEVQAGDGVDERWLRLDGLASRRRLTRIDELPARCLAPAPSDPLSVFDVFRQTFAEHYPFFEMKGVDWSAVGERERRRLTAQSSPEELFEVLQNMLEPLEDAHTYLSAGDLDRGFGGRRPDPNPLSEESVARAFEIVDTSYLSAPPEALCNSQIFVGRLGDGVRYLRLRSFANYGDDYRLGLRCLETALDRLLTEPETIAGVILDIRVNDGGADPYGLAIASRLASSEYLAYTKETRNDPDDPGRWSAGQPSYVRPSGALSFTGPVVLLTGQRSVSAAETFTMALMGREPTVLRIGQSTQGVFSDVLSRTLPNGWRFGLPNERFLTSDGRSFDGPGVPPDVEVPVFAAEDLSTGVDRALEAAVGELTSGHS
jgi:hypothetical protein